MSDLQLGKRNTVLKKLFSKRGFLAFWALAVCRWRVNRYLGCTICVYMLVYIDRIFKNIHKPFVGRFFEESCAQSHLYFILLILSVLSGFSIDNSSGFCHWDVEEARQWLWPYGRFRQGVRTPWNTMVLLGFQYWNRQMSREKAESNWSGFYNPVILLVFLCSLCATLPVQMTETFLK